MAANRGARHDDHIILQPTVVAHVGIGHDQAIVADGGEAVSTILCTSVNGGTLSDDDSVPND
ncbi:hypothetical protein NHJ13051_007724 [Beauveria bassiana]|uniref:Uncharacterized protein n=1 Tax=Beauveria bassiana TaxID=176275 RepID=A0A2N6NUY5_BEABA|nr:hypothetical protein BM221_003547 [Beauveria bassiana]